MNKKNLYIVKVSYPNLPTFYITGDETNGSRKKYYLNHKTALNGGIDRLTDFPLPEGWRDYEVHVELKRIPWIIWDGEADEGYLHTRENFYIDPKSGKTEEDFIREVCRIVSGSSRSKTYNIRPYQVSLIKSLIDVLNKENFALLYSLPRTGKSLMGIVTGILMGYETMIVTTPVTNAEDSFREPVVQGKSFTFKGKTYSLDDGWRFYNKNNINEWDGDPRKCVFFFSFALERQNKGGAKFKKFLEKLNKSGAVVLSIVDEIHNTSDTKLSTDILKSLKADKTLYMSGTPYEDLLVGRFNTYNTIKFDLFDAIEAAKDERNELFFPNMEVSQPYNISSLLKKFMIDNPEARNFDCNDYARALASESSADYFVGQMFSKTNENGLMTEEREDELGQMIRNQVLIYAPDDFKSKKGKRTPALNLVKSLKKASKNPNSIFYQYEVRYADDFKSEEEVNAFQRKYEKTIIVAKQKFTTGVTLKKLDTIIIMRSVSSAELFTQIIYRVMTPCEGKSDVNIITLDAEMELRLIAGFIEARRMTNSGESAEELFKKLRGFITFSGSDLDWRSISIADIIRKVNKVCVKDIFDADYRGIGSISNLFSCYESLSDYQKEMLKLSSLDGTKIGGSMKITTSEKLPDTGSEDEDDEDKNENDDSQSNDNKVVKTVPSRNNRKELEKLKTIVSKIPENIFIYNLDTYEEVRDFVPSSMKGVEDIYVKFICDNENLIRVWLDDIKMAIKEMEDEDIFFIENFT